MASIIDIAQLLKPENLNWADEMIEETEADTTTPTTLPQSPPPPQYFQHCFNTVLETILEEVEDEEPPTVRPSPGSVNQPQNPLQSITMALAVPELPIPANNTSNYLKDGTPVRDFVKFQDLDPHESQQSFAIQEVTAGNLPSIDNFYGIFATMSHQNAKAIDMDKLCMPRRSRIIQIRQRLNGSNTKAPDGYAGNPGTAKDACWKHEVAKEYALDDIGCVCESIKDKKTTVSRLQPIVALESAYRIIATNHIRKDQDGKLTHLSRDKTCERVRFTSSQENSIIGGNETLPTSIIKAFVANCPGCKKKPAVKAREVGTRTTQRNGGNQGPKRTRSPAEPDEESGASKKRKTQAIPIAQDLAPLQVEQHHWDQNMMPNPFNNPQHFGFGGDGGYQSQPHITNPNHHNYPQPLGLGDYQPQPSMMLNHSSHSPQLGLEGYPWQPHITNPNYYNYPQPLGLGDYQPQSPWMMPNHPSHAQQTGYQPQPQMEPNLHLKPKTLEVDNYDPILPNNLVDWDDIDLEALLADELAKESKAQ